VWGLDQGVIDAADPSGTRDEPSGDQPDQLQGDVAIHRSLTAHEQVSIADYRNEPQYKQCEAQRPARPAHRAYEE
jgi:hypothetical protein